MSGSCRIIPSSNSIIFLEKKYVKKTNFAPVVFHRYQQTVTITSGWKRKKTIANFHNVHAYIRYLSTPGGLSQPKLMLKIFDEHAPHAVQLNYFLDLGPADTEYELAAQWCVICQFMDTNQDYPYHPRFWDAAIEHHYPEDFAKFEADKGYSQESGSARSQGDGNYGENDQEPDPR